jgi:hypothetical protein
LIKQQYQLLLLQQQEERLKQLLETGRIEE